MKRSLRRSGFTLIELLVVVAIIGILAALVSSAILKLTKTAASKRNTNNAERLEAAIVEYWHDKGRWPLPKGARPKIKKVEHGYKGLEGSKDAGNDVTVQTYTMSYAADNHKIVNNLLDVPVDGGTVKTFLDLHGYMTPADPSATPPYEEVVDAWQYHEDNKGSPLTLVYFAPFLECPKCHRYWAATGSRNFCTDAECKKANGGKEYRFTKSEKAHPVSKAMPFVIDFDLFSNIVDVRAP